MENSVDVKGSQTTTVEDLKSRLDVLRWHSVGVLRLADLATPGKPEWGQQMVLQVTGSGKCEWITFAPDNGGIRSLLDWYKFARDKIGWTRSIVLCMYSPDE